MWGPYSIGKFENNDLKERPEDLMVVGALSNEMRERWITRCLSQLTSTIDKKD